ncbi:flavoprotein-like protein [Aspergillus ambiguus]|uniref:flavin-dependent quinone reductase n=1 Tax=Aspergillus ambiguus TaxID=176160 RepID=UPI003CCDC10C
METKFPRIGLIVCSQRSPRAGLQIGEFVLHTIKNGFQAADISLIDLAEWNLPLCNEPDVPSQLSSVNQYTHAHTKAWSKEITSYDAFIFVTPQYNWGYPASIKNAIDYLYHEWKGKPALIVSYGGHGGGKAAAQLRQVLQGVRMNPMERTVLLTFPDKEVVVQAARGRDLGLRQDDGLWAEERDGIKVAFGELLQLCSGSTEVYL